MRWPVTSALPHAATERLRARCVKAREVRTGDASSPDPGGSRAAGPQLTCTASDGSQIRVTGRPVRRLDAAR